MMIAIAVVLFVVIWWQHETSGAKHGKSRAESRSLIWVAKLTLSDARALLHSTGGTAAGGTAAGGTAAVICLGVSSSTTIITKRKARSRKGEEQNKHAVYGLYIHI